MSFSSETKAALATEFNDKDCCRQAMLAGMLYFSPAAADRLTFKTESREVSEVFSRLLLQIVGIETQAKKAGIVYKTEILGEDFEKTRTFTNEMNFTEFFQCRKCDNAFFRGAFLAAGFVNPPEKSWRIELSTPDADLACNTATALTMHFRMPKLSVRRGNQIIYYRDAESIEYFLSYIGANKAAFAIINAQMLKEKKNEINRKTNCDVANLNKTVTASGIYVEAIQALMESGDFDKLPAELKATAKLRIENDTLSLSELSSIAEPPVSKSQISKRLQKIHTFYKSLTSEP